MSRYPAAAARTEKGDAHPPLGRILEHAPKGGRRREFSSFSSTGADAERERESFHLASVEREAASTKREREVRGEQASSLSSTSFRAAGVIMSPPMSALGARGGVVAASGGNFPRRACAQARGAHGARRRRLPRSTHKGGGGERSARTPAADVEREKAGAARFPAALFRDQRNKAKIKRTVGCLLNAKKAANVERERGGGANSTSKRQLLSYRLMPPARRMRRRYRFPSPHL